MRVEGISPEFMLEHSFYQFQNAASVPVLEKKLYEIEENLKTITIEDESTVREYYDLRKQLDVYNEDVRHIITHPAHILTFLQGGRLIKVKIGEFDYDWGVVVDFQKDKINVIRVKLIQIINHILLMFW